MLKPNRDQLRVNVTPRPPAGKLDQRSNNSINVDVETLNL